MIAIQNCAKEQLAWLDVVQIRAPYTYTNSVGVNFRQNPSSPLPPSNRRSGLHSPFGLLASRSLHCDPRSLPRLGDDRPSPRRRPVHGPPEPPRSLGDCTWPGTGGPLFNRAGQVDPDSRASDTWTFGRSDMWTIEYFDFLTIQHSDTQTFGRLDIWTLL